MQQLRPECMSFRVQDNNEYGQVLEEPDLFTVQNVMNPNVLFQYSV